MMASPHSLPQSLALALTLLALLMLPTHSLKCTSQKFTNNKLYTNCLDLPTLDAYLHYTYNSTNSSLSVAFTARPATPDGWVAWAVNPQGKGMVGAQALVALTIDGSLMVKTYDIISYEELDESNLSFETWDVSAESNSKDYTIFASIKVPSQKFNHLWQVGPSVTEEMPDMHQLKPANLQSKGMLELAATSHRDVGSSANGFANSHSLPLAPIGAIANSPTAAPPTNGGNNAGTGFGICTGLVALLCAFTIGF